MSWERRRDFWIYLLVTFFVVIIGLYCLVQEGSQRTPSLPVVCLGLLWMISIGLTLALVYSLYYRLYLRQGPEEEWIGTERPSLVWLNLWYSLILILAVVWACQVGQGDPALYIFPALLIILLLFLLQSYSQTPGLSLYSWLTVANVLIWIGMIIVLVTNPPLL